MLSDLILLLFEGFARESFFAISVVALMSNRLDIQGGFDYAVCLLSRTQCSSYCLVDGFHLRHLHGSTYSAVCSAIIYLLKN